MVAKADLAVASTPGLVSIVIPCCGMLEYTKLCVPSVLRNSRPPFELIFLDVGSLDGTAEFLSGLQMGLGGIRVHIERTPTDLGLKGACQRALREARGEFIVLLNNDTVVTNGWLNQLLGLVTFSMGIGLVGPMSNHAAEPQLVEPVPYRSSANPGIGAAAGDLLNVNEVENFAIQFNKEHQGNWINVDSLGGFCLLLKREVLNKIGPALDEWSDLSLFDTDIFSAKARQAGYSLAVCRDLFVHHFGTRMFVHGPSSKNRESS